MHMHVFENAAPLLFNNSDIKVKMSTIKSFYLTVSDSDFKTALSASWHLPCKHTHTHPSMGGPQS